MLNKAVSKIMQRRGYEPYVSSYLFQTFMKDFSRKNVSLKRKIWAWRRGFFVFEADEYGLNDDNVHKYVSTSAYYKLHRVNKKFRKWVDDKLTVKMIINGISRHLMPEYYYMVREGKFIKLSDLSYDLEENVDGFLLLLELKENLAIKNISGSKGVGFYKLSYAEGKYYINNNHASKDEVVGIFRKSNDVVITEYITPHSRLKKIYPEAPNAIRVMIVNNEGSNPEIVGAFIRFGTKETGVIDNASVGGIFSGIELDSGRLVLPQRYIDGKLADCKYHPDTNEELSIEIPDWELVKEHSNKIAMGMPGLKLMGIDIVVTDQGPKIIEINSHPMILRMQQYYPLLQNRAFMELTAYPR